MMHQDVTFLVSSCDKYEDAWHPFFELLHIYGGDFHYPIVLNTESKQYRSEHFDVRVINTPFKATWSERMMNVLQQIDTEYVFLLLDDFFLQSPFNHGQFDKVVEYMRNNPDVGVMHMTPSARFKDLPSDMFFERTFDELNITVTAVLWRKTYLNKILRKHENIWDFEWFSGIRAKKYPERVMQYNEKYPIIFSYTVALNEGYGISQGKWLPKNQELFERHGITVNFDSLGICYTDYAALGWRFLPDNPNPYKGKYSPSAIFHRVVRAIHNRYKRYLSLR